MAIDLRQSLRLSQQLVITPQLQQAIKLLQLNRIELSDFIAQQIAENPMLEDKNQAESEDKTSSETKERTSDDVMQDELNRLEGTVDNVSTSEKKDVDWEALSRVQESLSQPLDQKKQQRRETVNYEEITASQQTLSDFLSKQVSELDFNEREKKIAIIIIGNLSEKGYLELELKQVAEQLEFDLEEVEGVLDTIQRLQPLGIAARDLKECLLIQLRELNLKNGIIEKIVSNHLTHLENHNYKAIAKTLSITFDEVIMNVGVLAELDPIPAREFGGVAPQLILPDVYTLKTGGEWVVMMNEEGLPKLRLNHYYQNLVRKKVSGSDKQYLQEHIQTANWLIKSVQQRQSTILRVATKIVERQKAFLEAGVEKLKSMVLKDVADALGLHESTVSRVTSQKYIHTPRGIFELKYFFAGSMTSLTGKNFTNTLVKESIKAFIEKESPQNPFSDKQIVTYLEGKGIPVARRTVAKYREVMGILSSSRRKRLRTK